MSHRLMPAGKTGAWLMIVYTSTLHTVWAVLNILTAEPLSTTPMWGLMLLIPNRWEVSLALVVGAVAAVIGGAFSLQIKGLVLMMPQQMLLLASVSGILKAVAAGAYADGVPRSSLFILADQLPLLLIAPAYIFAILYYHLGRR